MKPESLGRRIEIVKAAPGPYEVAYRVVGPKVTYDLVHIGHGLLQPRNSRGNFCAIAGNYFFWVGDDGEMHWGTRDAFSFRHARQSRPEGSTTPDGAPSRIA